MLAGGDGGYNIQAAVDAACLIPTAKGQQV
jgi:hypothetical protein